MDIDTNDPISKMEAELFITGRAQFEYPIPYKSEGGYLRDLQQGAMGDKLKALRAIIHLYRGKNAFAGGYTRESAEGAAAIFKKFASSPELCGQASRELFLEGSMCENCGDYEGATWFLEASLHFENPDKEFCYYRLNNLAFNLLCLNKFKEAEVYKKKTVEKTVEKILTLIRLNPGVTQNLLEKKSGLTRRGVEWNLKKLKDAKMIRRVGPDKGGHWEIIR